MNEDWEMESEEGEEEEGAEDYYDVARISGEESFLRALGVNVGNGRVAESTTGSNNVRLQEVVVNVDSQSSGDHDSVAVEGDCEFGERSGVTSGKQDGCASTFQNGDVRNEVGRVSQDEIDGLVCPICLEAWSSSGEHRISCLPCGHIYGLSCIKKWLRREGSRKCPQCKKRCGIKDIRQLYASQIVTVDGELQKNVQSLQAKCTSLERKCADWSKREAEWKKREADLRNQLKSEKEMNRELQHRLVAGAVSTLNASSTHCSYRGESCIRPVTIPNFLGERHQSEFLLERDFHVEGARLFDIDVSSQIFVVARRLPGCGGTHVLTKVGFFSNHDMEDIPLPPNLKAVKDVQASPQAKLVLLASLGKKLLVLSTESNNAVLTYDLPAASWSCAWDVCNSEYLYTGLQNGTVLQFDMRHTATFVECMPGLSSNPIHTLHSFSTSPTMSSNIRSILTASSVGLCQWNFGGNEQRPYFIPESGIEGVCISVSCSNLSNHIVASYRAKIEGSESTITPPTMPVRGIHVLYGKTGGTYHKLKQTCSTVNGIRLPKSAIVDGVYENPVFTSADELTCQLMFKALPSLTVTDSLGLQCPPLDIKFKGVSSLGILGCLCNDTMKLFTAKLL